MNERNETTWQLCINGITEEDAESLLNEIKFSPSTFGKTNQNDSDFWRPSEYSDDPEREPGTLSVPIATIAQLIKFCALIDDADKWSADRDDWVIGLHASRQAKTFDLAAALMENEQSNRLTFIPQCGATSEIDDIIAEINSRMCDLRRAVAMVGNVRQ